MIKQLNAATVANVDAASRRMDKQIANIVQLGSLDGKVLIVDEAHNLFRAIINGSKNGVELYDMVMRAKNAKVIFLTGTPVSNHPFELVPCFNMLVGTTALPVLPENWDDFGKFFIDRATNTIKNKAKFQNRIMGLVSYITHKSKPGAAAHFKVVQKQVEFPEQLQTQIVEVNMGETQYVKYLLARDREQAETKGFMTPDTPNLQKPKSSTTSSYRVRSRQLSNYGIPDSAPNAKEPADVPLADSGSPKFDAIRERIESGVGLDLVYSQFTGIGGIGMFARYLTQFGYSEYKLEAMAKPPRKVNTGADVGASTITFEHTASLSDANSSVVIDKEDANTDVDDVGDDIENIATGEYEEREYEGEYEGGEITDWYVSDGDDADDDAGDAGNVVDGGKSSASSASPTATKTPKSAKSTKSRVFAFITGEVDPVDRNRILQIYNSAGNTHGELLSLLLISSTGAEGLDAKNIRRIHIMEPYWSNSRHAQVISRGVRNDSHIALPPAEKNVQPYIYIAVKPKSEVALPDSVSAVSQDGPSTDQELYEKSMASYRLIDDFTKAIQEVSIECLLNGESYCRTCSPTNIPLYSNNIILDLKTGDPCVHAVEKKVVAEEVIVNGDKYYYKPSTQSVFGYDIFEHDAELNTFRKMSEDSPLYQKIVKEVDKGAGKGKKNK
jgi:hypothetical protein